jgi:hypothetical protein
VKGAWQKLLGQFSEFTSKLKTWGILNTTEEKGFAPVFCTQLRCDSHCHGDKGGADTSWLVMLCRRLSDCARVWVWVYFYVTSECTLELTCTVT